MGRRIDNSTPDPMEELERKTNETLAKILHHIEAAEWTFPRAMDALDVLWGVSSGLVSKDLMDSIAATHTYCRTELNAGRDRYAEPAAQDEMGTW